MALVCKHRLLLLLLLSIATCCNAEDQRRPSETVLTALNCFTRQDMYSNCQDEYRLNAQGVINVPRAATDGYCSGPCLRETEMVLDCVDNILSSFVFYNGATTRNVRDTIHSACGRDWSRRGDFNVLDRINGYYNGESLRVAVPWVTLGMTILSYALILFSPL